MYLNGGEGIISNQSIDKMFYRDTVYVEDDVPFWYGYGWATVKESLSEPVLRHSGLVETGTSCVFILPESGIGVAITTNVNDYFVTNEMMDSLGWGVILMLLGESPNEITDNTRPSQKLCKPPIWCKIEAPYWRFNYEQQKKTQS
jgi:CubicO group peptidase (beta-lactamase class C family)